MAGLGEMLQRIARSLEEAQAQQPGDDLRARLGYGAGAGDEYADEYADEDEHASESIWAPERGSEAARTPASDWEPVAAERESEAVRTPPSDWEPETIWSPARSRPPARATAAAGAPEPARALPSARLSGRRPHPPAAPPRSPAASASPLPERIRARLHTPDALREAFVVKEILDRPLGRRQRRQ